MRALSFVWPWGGVLKDKDKLLCNQRLNIFFLFWSQLGFQPRGSHKAAVKRLLYSLAFPLPLWPSTAFTEILFSKTETIPSCIRALIASIRNVNIQLWLLWQVEWNINETWSLFKVYLQYRCTAIISYVYFYFDSVGISCLKPNLVSLLILCLYYSYFFHPQHFTQNLTDVSLSCPAAILEEDKK